MMAIGLWLAGCVLLGILFGALMGNHFAPKWILLTAAAIAGYAWTEFCISFGGLTS